MAIEKLTKGDKVIIRRGVTSKDEDHYVAFRTDVIGMVWEIKGEYAVVDVSKPSIRATYDPIDLIKSSQD